MESFDRILREVYCLYETEKERVEKNNDDWGGELSEERYSTKRTKRHGKRETGLDMENESVFESEESVNKFKWRLMKMLKKIL